MCGLVGYFKSRSEEISIDLLKGAEAIRHRGPDMGGITDTPLYKIAFNRLSINDLSPSGMQPFSYSGVDAFMNGEIYNHKELKATHKNEFSPRSTSDTEILPFLYRRSGISCLNQLNGPFSIALIDEVSGECFLANDRFGVKPLYYTSHKGALFFASELKALKALLTLAVDPLAVSMAASCFYFPSPSTPFKGVKRLAAGTFLRFKDGQITVSRWYNMRITANRQPDDGVREEFMGLFESAVGLRLDCDVPVGGFISGGMDSTSILSVAHRQYRQDMHVFNAVIENKASHEGNEVDNINAKRLAKDLNLHYHEVKINWDAYNRNIVKIAASHDEIMFENGNIIFYLIAEEAKKYVTVILDGVGGDELFGVYPFQRIGQKLGGRRLLSLQRALGYPYSPNLGKLLSRLPRGYVRTTRFYKALTDLPLWNTQSMGIIPLWLFGDRLKGISDNLTEIGSDYFDLAINSVPDDFNNAINACNIFTVIAAQNVEVDRGTMAHSIEGRSPFLDYRLFELMMSVNGKAKIAGGHKSIMKQWFSGQLPQYITEAPKSGPALALTNWISTNREAASAIDRLLMSNLGLIEMLLGDAFANAVRKRSYAVFGSGLTLHALLALVIWAKKNVGGENFDLNQTLIELAD